MPPPYYHMEVLTFYCYGREGRSPCYFCVQMGGLAPHRVSTDNMVGKALAPLGNGRNPDSPPGLF